jgi:hypothetical protein
VPLAPQAEALDVAQMPFAQQPEQLLPPQLQAPDVHA